MLKFALLGILAGGLHANPIFPYLVLNPIDGTISGNPGDVIGWGFTLQGDSTYWVSVTAANLAFEVSPVGTFTSYINQNGGLTDFATPPGQAWTQTFSPGSPGTGIGEYDVDPGATVGSSDSGLIDITYDIYADDPLTCNCNAINNAPLHLTDINGHSIPFAIQIVPESGASILSAIGGGLLILAQVLRRKARSSTGGRG
jgi:hypothetical protein